MAELIDFGDLAPAEAPVRYGGRAYVLREPSADAAAKYRTACARCGRMQDGRVVGVDGVGDVEPMLVSLCLYRAAEGGGLPLTPKGEPDAKHLVAPAELRGWQAKAVKRMFDWLKEAGGLGDDETLDALAKQRERIDRRIAELKGAGDGAEGAGPNGPPPGGTSASSD